MSTYVNKTASALIKTGYGKIRGVFVSSASGSPSIRLVDGLNSNDDAADKATGTLTISGAIADGQTATIGSTVYRFKDTPAQAYDVQIGVSDAVTLDNLKAAINASGTEGVEYFAGTLIHPTVTATTNTDTAQTVEAKTAGTAGNSIATTETMTNGAWGAATLTGGLEANRMMIDTFTPVAATMYDFGGDGIDFVNGLYLTIGGTVECTLLVD